MNRPQIAPTLILSAIIVTLVFVVIGSIQADEVATQTSASAPSSQTADPATVREDQARIRRYLPQTTEFREIGGVVESQITVTHLTARYYVAKVVYSKANDWRLYLVSPLPDSNAYDVSPVGVAAGERGLQQCVGVLLQNQGWPKSKIDFPGIVEQSLQALAADYGVVLKRNEDVPGYAKAPLPADFSAVIRPMWTYASKGLRGDQVHYVIYTYQQIGGQVLRHEFVFGTKGWDVTTLRLAERVGDVQYLQ
jgi:hypothetical protein